MKVVYQKAKAQIQSLNEVDQELPWLLTLDLVVIAAGVGYCIGLLA